MPKIAAGLPPDGVPPCDGGVDIGWLEVSEHRGPLPIKARNPRFWPPLALARDGPKAFASGSMTAWMGHSAAGSGKATARGRERQITQLQVNGRADR